MYSMGMSNHHDSRLEFGVLLPQGWIDDLKGLGFEYIKRFALTAETLGFSLWAYDHFIPYKEYRPFIGKPMLECWILLSSIAGVTSKARIGQVVTCNSYRNPALLAKMASTLDYISNGRLEFGIGAGWYEEEYVSYGYQFPSARARIEQLDEALNIIRAMWVDEEASTFHGKYHKVINAVNYPKPVQKPHPPIMVGGSGRLLLKVAAKHADIYNCPFVDVDGLTDKLRVLKEHCINIRRDYSTIVKSLLMRVIIADRHETLIEKIRVVKRSDESIDWFISRNKGSTIIGTPDDVARELQGYAAIGVRHFILHPLPIEEDLESLRLLIDACKKV